MKYLLKKLSKAFFKKYTTSNSNESTFYEDDTWELSSSSKDDNNNSRNKSSSLSDDNDPWREKIVDTLSFKEDETDEELLKGKEIDEIKFVNGNDSYLFCYITFSFLFLIIPPFLIKLFLFFVIIVKLNTTYTITQNEYKQLHIFYDYETFIEFLKSVDYNYYKSLDPFFGLMEAHIRSYIRLHGIDLHFYEVYPEVAEWRKRGYEKDFEWVFERLNRILSDRNIVIFYSLDNIKEYGFKYYNY